jgi:archaemetzincin
MSGLSLLPLGAPPGEILDVLERELAAVFGLGTRRLTALPEPASALDAARGQWSATEILKALLPRARSRERLLGVTERDLFVPVLSFVYGQAQLRGPVAVVSLARLRPEFFGLPPDPALLARRALTEAVHELGHTFGLVHCLERRCPMALSLGLEDLDSKGAWPCPTCEELLEGSLEMRRCRTPDAGAAGGEA